MSGGVDSSVAATLLVEQGYPVIGMMLRLWSETGREDENRCCTPDAMAQARRVAAHLGIPFYVLDVRQQFRQTVVQAFIDGYTAGITPNPCAVCNRQIRWGSLLSHAMALGAQYLATGHYARLRQGDKDIIQLLRGRDENKDQSYILSVLTQRQLRASLFPIGGLLKSEVRAIARSRQLPVAERADSQDLCFLGNQDYRQFLTRHAPETIRRGQIVNRKGEVLGQHDGLAFYTIGQRKGLGIAAPKPYYVIEKDLERNTLVVGFAEELGKSELQVDHINWISGKAPSQPLRVQVKIRYKAQLAQATLSPQLERQAYIHFDQPLRDITAGQLAVFYDGDVVLGSGIIQG